MFDDDKELIRSRHMKRARHYNCKRKMDKMDNDLGNTAQKLNIKQHEHYLNYL
jgi:hypothetical protein